MLNHAFSGGRGAARPSAVLWAAWRPSRRSQLGGIAIKAVIGRAKITPHDVEEVIVGDVLSAGLGQNVARQSAIAAGLSPSVGATTVNKVCGSSLKAVMLAAQSIQCGDAAVVVAAGTENMSQSPYLLPKARAGLRMGNGEVVDSMIRDGLWDVYNNVHMGICGDRCAAKYQMSRQEQDDFAVASYTSARRPSRRYFRRRDRARRNCRQEREDHLHRRRGTAAVQRGETAEARRPSARTARSPPATLRA